jgi:hypothetical protein
MNKKEQLIEQYFDEKLLFADGFDEAIIGFDSNSMRVVYSKQKMIEIMENEMPLDEAIEYLEFNTFCAYVGEQTPIFMDEIDVF